MKDYHCHNDDKTLRLLSQDLVWSAAKTWLVTKNCNLSDRQCSFCRLIFSVVLFFWKSHGGLVFSAPNEVSHRDNLPPRSLLTLLKLDRNKYPHLRLSNYSPIVFSLAAMSIAIRIIKSDKKWYNFLTNLCFVIFCLEKDIFF